MAPVKSKAKKAQAARTSGRKNSTVESKARHEAEPSHFYLAMQMHAITFLTLQRFGARLVRQGAKDLDKATKAFIYDYSAKKKHSYNETVTYNFFLGLTYARQEEKVAADLARYPGDLALLDRYADLGIKFYGKTRNAAILDAALEKLAIAEERSGDPEIGKIIRRARGAMQH
jgi:hypothetical protein